MPERNFSFQLKISLINMKNLQKAADLFLFNNEIVNGELYL